jgi:ribose transport system permease protein
MADDRVPPLLNRSRVAVAGKGAGGAGISAHLNRIAAGVFSEYSIVIFIGVYFLAASLWLPQIASQRNLANLLVSMLPLLVVGMGQTVVLITGGIDLSLPSLVSAVSVVAAWAMVGIGGVASPTVQIVVGVAAALGVGVAVGLFNGLAITRLKMPPFMVTLSSMMVLSGLALWSTGSQNISRLPESFVEVGYGKLAGIPYAVLTAVVVGLLLHVLLSRTLLGAWLYAVGHNPTASLISGVPVSRVIVSAYVISGLCGAIGSLLYTARLESGSPVLGRELLLDVVGACVIGGTSLFGGRGKIVWTVLGVLLFAMLDNTLTLIGLEYYTVMTVKGTVILLAAALDVLRHRLAGGA